MRTSTLSAAFVPYHPNLPLRSMTRQTKARQRSQFRGLGADAAVVGMSAAQGAAAGASVGGPVGAAVGAIVGIARGLLTKNYLNVGQMNAAEVQEVNAFNQYRPIAGQVAGRDIGYPALNTVFNGAVHSNIFPINNEKQCFHEGCSTYPGNASWSDQAMYGGSSDKNTIPDIVPQAISAGVLDPRTILTQYWIPAQNAKGNHWAVPVNSIGQQILIDIIDAYVADHVPNAPYFYAKPQNAVIAATPVMTAQQPAATSQVLTPTPVQPTSYPVPSGYTYSGQTNNAGHLIVIARDGSYYEFNQYTNQLSAMAQPSSIVSSSVPTGYSDTGQKAPNGLELYEGPDQNFYTWDGSVMAFYMTAGGSTVTQTGTMQIPTPVTSGIDPNTQNLINQLIQQGQSQQAAYQAALQQLAAQGQALTPQLQQQVATAVQANPSAAGIGTSNVAMMVGLAILGLLFVARSRGGPEKRR